MSATDVEVALRAEAARPGKHAYRREYVLAAVLAGALLVLFIGYGLQSSGTYYDDDVAHYLIARYSWSHPALLFNIWGRPAFTVLYSPASQFGFPAARAFSAVLATLTCILAAYLARLYRLHWWWLAVPLTGLQPEFVRQAFSNLTELTFAFLLCLALLGYKRQKWLMMALTAGLLPLARYESLPLLLVFAVIIIQQKRAALLPLLIVPMLVQNSVEATLTGNWLRLLFPLNRFIDSAATRSVLDYQPGDAFYYVRRLPDALGWLPLLLACVPVFIRRLGLLKLMCLIVVGVLSITYWLMPEAGVAGYIRHLATIAPAVGVLAAAGFEMLVLRPRPGWTALKTALAVGVVLLLAVSTLRQVRPFPANHEDPVLRQAASWYLNSEYRDRLVLGSHARFELYAELDPFDPARFMQITPANIAAAPQGALIIWDSHYSHRLGWQTPLESLNESPDFRKHAAWDENGFSMHIFEKLTGASAREAGD